MEDHIKKICKTCHFHLTNISKIRTYLDRESTEAIIHAFVTTNLDHSIWTTSSSLEPPRASSE